MTRKLLIVNGLFLASISALVAACGVPEAGNEQNSSRTLSAVQSTTNESTTTNNTATQNNTASTVNDTDDRKSQTKNSSQTSTTGHPKQTTDKPKATPSPVKQPAPSGPAVQVVANPDSVDVLVNKHYELPKGFTPPDLVIPNVPFIFSEKLEKRYLRKPAAEALEKMFAAAKGDGVLLAGVSGYRSYSTQVWLFNSYAQQYGRAAANRFSALPGESEHQTGLAIDVSGIDGKYAAEDGFAGTKEAVWLAKHADEYGFIIRYPKGKEAITGYKYEPWHIRYVGLDVAETITKEGITLEEYLDVVPVSGKE